MPEKQLITPSDIADLAGVALSTVSNWIRRFDDFPVGEFVGDTSRRRYDAEEVVDWLNRRQLSRRPIQSDAALLRLEPDMRESFLGTLFVVIHSLESPESATTDEVIARYHQLLKSPLAELLNFDLAASEDLVSATLPSYQHLSGLHLADILKDFSGRRQPRGDQELTTPEALASFIAALSPATSGVTLDLASGEGGLLEKLLTEGVGSQHVGREINPGALMTARRRALLKELPITYYGRSGTEPTEGINANVVVADPPLGIRMASEELNKDFWPSIKPCTGDVTTAFILRAAEALSPDGTAFVLTPLSLLSRTGEFSEFRRSLLLHGLIRGVVSLPPKLRQSTSIPLALWILGPPSPHHAGIVMADASLSNLEDLAPNGPIVKSIKAELSADEAHRDENYATTVAVRDLLTKDVALRPNSWVAQKRDIVEPQEQLASAIHALKSVEELTALPIGYETALTIGDVDPALLTVEELQERQWVKILRAHGGRAKEDGNGPRVVDLSVLTGKTDHKSARRLEDASEAGLMIQAGDILVAPLNDRILATVWVETGWVAGPAVSIVRPEADTIDPVFLAAAIEHPRNLAHIDPGAVKVNLRIRALEVPDIPLPQQRRLAELLRILDNEQKELQQKVAAVEESQATMRTALASGTLKWEPVGDLD